MYRVVAANGDLITMAADFEVACSLLRRIPRAHEIRCDESGVLLAWRPRDNMLALVGFGEHAGAPGGAEAAFVAGGGVWN